MSLDANTILSMLGTLRKSKAWWAPKYTHCGTLGRGELILQTRMRVRV